MACSPAPEVGFVSTLYPERPDTHDDLVALALTTDGSAEGFTYHWFIGDTEILDVSEAWVSSSRTARDQVWTLRVRHERLPGVQEHKVVIGNASPLAPEVQILPEGAHDGDDLICQAAEEASDGDGDALELSWMWWVDGQEAAAEGDTVAASLTVAGQQWTCELRVSDGLDQASSSASVVLVDRGEDWPEQVRDLADADYVLSGVTNTGEGFNAGEWSGWRLAGLGDYDGDGLADALTVGRFNDTLADDAGKVYLLSLAELRPGEQGLEELGTTWLGEVENGHLGRDVAGPGDLDGDGLGEVLMSTYADYEGHEEAGSVHLFLSADRALGGATLASEAHLIIQGRAHHEWVGRSLDGAGDVDGDGVPDLFVGLPGFNSNTGRAAVFEGSQALVGGALTSEDAAWIFEGDEIDGDAGIAVTRAGDMDGDGLGDLLVGAPLDDGAGAEAGAVVVLLGLW